MLIFFTVFFQSVFAASNMTLEVKQRIGALSAASTSASSSGSLSDEEAIDLLLELIMFVVETIDETIDNITISIDNLAEVSNAHSSLLENLTNTTNYNVEVINSNTDLINDNFDAVKYWFIIVGVVSFFLFLATWIAIIVLFCRDPMRGWRGAEARPMTSYSTA